jgi:hypothetical protein
MRAWISSKERSGMAGWLWGGRWLGWLISVPGLIYRGRSGFGQIGFGSLRLQGREDDRWSKGFKGLEVPWSAVYIRIPRTVDVSVRRDAGSKVW